MPSGEDADEKSFNDVLLADNHLAEFIAHLLVQIPQMVDGIQIALAGLGYLIRI